MKPVALKKKMRTGIGIHQLYISVTQLIKFLWKAITALLCQDLAARRNFIGCYHDHVLNSRTFSLELQKDRVVVVLMTTSRFVF